MFWFRKLLRLQNHWKFVNYLTVIVFILRSHVDELKGRINSEWTTLSHVVIERAVDKWRQRLRACVRAGGDT